MGSGENRGGRVERMKQLLAEGSEHIRQAKAALDQLGEEQHVKQLKARTARLEEEQRRHEEEQKELEKEDEFLLKIRVRAARSARELERAAKENPEDFDLAALQAMNSLDSVTSWRGYERAGERLERAAERDPCRFAAKALKIIEEQREETRALIRIFFGEEIYFQGRSRKSRVVKPEHAPQTPREKTLYEKLCHDLIFSERTLLAMASAGEKEMLGGANESSVARAVCEEFLKTWRALPAWEGKLATRADSSEIRLASLKNLSDWLQSQIRLGTPRGPTRTKKALDDSNTTLPEELPTAALLGFSDMKPGEPLRPPGGRKKSFVSRVECRLVDLGREVISKSKWIVDEALPEQITAGSELFTAQEEAARQVKELKERGGLTQNEDATLRLESAGHTQREIAAQRQVTEGTIKSEKSRAVSKMKRAAGQ